MNTGQRLIVELGPYFSQETMARVVGVSDRRIRHYKKGYEIKRGKRVRAEMTQDQIRRLSALKRELKGKLFMNRSQSRPSKAKNAVEGRHYRWPLVVNDVFQADNYVKFMGHLREMGAGILKKDSKFEENSYIRFEVVVRCLYKEGVYVDRSANSPIRGDVDKAIADIDRILGVWISDSPLTDMYVARVKAWRYRK